MPKTRRILTNFSKGEISPLLDGHVNLAAYWEGCRTLENFLLLRQGGVTRRPGTRYVAAVKDPTTDSILLPFVPSVDRSYVVEAGDAYLRFFTEKAPILVSAAGAPVELVSPYPDTDLRALHVTQSVDVLYLFHMEHPQQQLQRVSDLSWSIADMVFSPPPSFEDDTDIGTGASAGANITLGVSANSGAAKAFRTSADVFLAADAGRQLVAGAGRAIITAVVNARQVTVNILNAFNATITAGPNALTSGSAGSVIMTSTAHGLAIGNYVVLTSGVQAGEIRRVVALGASAGDTSHFTIEAAWSGDQVATTWNKVLAKSPGGSGAGWRLRLSPQTTLDPTIKEPIGAQVTVVAGAAAFRAADVGKFIFVYGGLIELTILDSTTQMRGQILSPLSQASDANPAVAPAGAWTLEVSSWSVARGFPRTGEFFQGRLYAASSGAQPTTVWGSRSDDYTNNAVGVEADNAVEFTLAARQLNQIQWLADNDDLVIGTGGSEHLAKSGQVQAPIGGDVIPLITRIGTNGCAPIQPVQTDSYTLFWERARRRLYAMAYELASDNVEPFELTAESEHISAPNGIDLGPMAFAQRLDPRLYVCRGGTLLVLTYFVKQKVVGWSRIVTDGLFKSVAIVTNPDGGNDLVYVLVERTIDSATVRYVEVFEDAHEDLPATARRAMQTDCGVVTVLPSATASVGGLAHLEGEEVDVLVNGGYVGRKTVASGAITFDDALVANDVVEAGLPYTSTLETMRPAVEGQVIEGLPRSWDSLFVRLQDTIGGQVNGQDLLYAPSDLDEIGLFSGDRKVTGIDWGTDGRITVTQTQPYPMTVLATFGTLSVGDKD